jgi:hypothetical protein
MKRVLQAAEPGTGLCFARIQGMAEPAAPYYAVIFSSTLRENPAGYVETAERMVELAKTMPGFLGIESARGADGFGITVSYWKDEAAIANGTAIMNCVWRRWSGRIRGRANKPNVTFICWSLRGMSDSSFDLYSVRASCVKILEYAS